MPFDGDPLAFYGKLIIEEHHASLLGKFPEIKFNKGDPDPLDISDDKLRLVLQEKVGILGAGIGGLYTALIFDSLNIDYEIIEASGRVGGRLKTHHFQGGGEYDYYDEGAMRFPLPKKDKHGKYKDGTMKRLAELTEYEPLNRGPNPLRRQFVPYYYSARRNLGGLPGFYYFNGVHQSVVDGNDPPGPHTENPSGFRARAMGVPDVYKDAGASAIHEDAINPFVRALVNDIEKGTKDGWKVMKQNETYSIRGYMASKYLPSYSLQLPPEHLSNDVINWVDLIQSSSGGYDLSLAETVFQAVSFANVGGNNYGDVDWKCFRGGSETLPRTIENYLKTRNSFVQFNKRVTAMNAIYTTVTIADRYLKQKIPAGAKRQVLDSGEIVIGDDDDKKTTFKYPGVAVTVNGSETRCYDHVISTLPLPILRTVNLSGAGLNILQKNALRALAYGPSVKIAVRFKSNWWTTKLGITGGQSFTDLPIRTIVYPSYGVDSATPSTVLIASYTWTTDASRLGALALKPERDVLKELVLRNLAEAHEGVNNTIDKITYDFLVRELADGENFHVKDWNADEYTMGAFGDFGPGEFENLYASLNVPAANGCLHFAGEAVSTRHGWVVGALDSAWKAVYEYLKLTGQDEKLEQFLRLWGTNTEWTTGSTLLDEGPDHDLLDEHIALVIKAILAGVV